jgi:23S rRNA pseudouridine2605 synthase
MAGDARRVGLARAMSKLGYCSRSRAFQLIGEGRVRLNGLVRRNPEYPVELERDCIEVDQQRIQSKQRIYLMLNKPRGIVTTASDEKGRNTVYDLLDQGLGWVAPVGRLDKATEGLLLLTNDSEWAGAITDPDSHLDKIYHVQINAIADDLLLGRLRRGIHSNSDFLAVKNAEILRTGQKTSWLKITLDEGKNRHIRRIFDELDIVVLRLVRVAIGPLPLGQLPKGKIRFLTQNEIHALTRPVAKG